MKARAVILTLALSLAGAALSFAQSPELGTWKLDQAKSHIPAAAVKNTTVIYIAEGDKVKVTTDGTLQNSPVHTEWTGKFDGKDYPVTGDNSADVRSYTRVNDHTLSLNMKKSGKVTTTGRIVLSPDGKSRTVTLHYTDAAGKKGTSTTVYDKE